MSVAYTRTTWKNHVVQHPRTYTLTENQDDTVTLAPAPGDIYQQGTPINDTNLNNIENGIVALVDECARLDDAKQEEVIYSVTIPASGWSGSAPPYSRSVSVSGIKATDNPIIDIMPSGTYATDMTMQENWGKIYRITTSNNSIKVYATEIPTAAIPVKVRCLR